MRCIAITCSLLLSLFSYSQSWQPVGAGNQSNSTHALLEWNGQLVVCGSFNNNPCDRVALWDGTNYTCLAGGVGIVARAGCVWNGNLIIVGDFWNNSQPCVGCNGVAMWDGTQWLPLDQGFNNDVLTCTVYNGDLIIGGDFTEANGVPINRVARWNETLGQFESMGGGTDMDNDVRCMAVYDSELWVGGDFNNIGGQGPLDGLVKWDETNDVWVGGNSGVDLIGGVNETVRVLFVHPTDGNLYMGGEFPELWDGDAAAEDFNMAGVAMYDGSNWYPLGTGLDDPSMQVNPAYCRAIHEYNGDLIVGGHFTTANGVACNKIAKWDGTNFSPMGQGFDGVGIDEYVKAAWTWNGIFFAGGAYTQAEGGPMNYLAQWYEASTNAPVAGINSSVSSGCEGDCIDFSDGSSGTPTSWNWSFPGAATSSSTNQNPTNICYNTAGTYTVTLEACNANGCDITTSSITVATTPTVSVNDQTICENDPLLLCATPSVGGGDFLWSTTETSQCIDLMGISTTTTYTVTYTLNGCTSPVESPTVTVNPSPTVTITPSNPTICDGQSISLTANPSWAGGTYSWIPSGTTQTINVSPSSTTSYIVNYTDANGCESSNITEVAVVQAFNITEDVTACENSTYTYPDGFSETISSNTSHTSSLTSSAGCDSIVVTNVSMQTAYNSSESISVCENTTYTYHDGFSETITGNTSHTSVLTSIDGCDSTIVTNVTMTAAYSTNENVTACENSTYTYPDGFSEIITGNSAHTSALTSVSGCDSIVVTNVTMQTAYNISESVSVCENTTYTYPDGFSETITVNTTHTSVLTSGAGCDSVIVTNVTVTNGYNINENVSACENSTYTFPDGFSETITGNSTHTSALTSVAGCDSIIVTNVTMQSSYSNSESVSVCENTTYTYPDGFSETITGNSTHTSALTSVGGCDSVIVTNVAMTSTYNTSENVNACENSTFTYPDGFSETITGNTSHTSALTSVAGCDSIVVTNVSMQSAYNISESVAVCENTTYTYPDGFSETITGNTTHTSAMTSNVGCDSIIVTNVTMNSAYSANENVTVCQNMMFTYPDGFSETITGNTSHTSALTSVAGCDSLVITNVTMQPIYSTSESASVCSGAIYTYPDGFSETISGATSHTSSLTTIAGCDSIVVTNVSLLPEYNLTDNISVCSGGTYTYPDGTLASNITANEDHISSLTTVNGCDSIIHTFITVSTAFNVTENSNVCYGDSYTYPDGTVSTNITVNESHVSTLTSSIGCDSIITTNVSVNATYNLNESISACIGSVVIYPDGSTENVTANTMHTSNLMTLSGCDSVIVTNVTVVPTYNESEDVTVCQGEIYTYPDGFSETIAGNTIHTSSLSSVDGCDSIVVTNVSMAPNYNSSENIDVCSGSTYTYPDGTVSTNITVNESHTSVLSSVNGCDSTIITNLIVSTVLNYTENVTLCEGDNYTYPDGTVSSNITVNESYTSSFTSQNGCDSLITTNVSVNPTPILNSISDETICEGETITLTATPSIGGGSYDWSPGGMTSSSISVSPSTNTTYVVTYTLNGCSSQAESATITVNSMPDVGTSSAAETITVNETSGSYQWLNCDNGNMPIAGETGQSYTATANGNYAVQVDLNGCIDTSACVAITGLGLLELISNSLVLHPNPATTEINVTSNHSLEGISFKIVDVMGRIIEQGEFGNTSVIDIDRLTSGSYFLELDLEGLFRIQFVKR